MSEHHRRRDHSPLASRYGLVRPLQGRYVAGVCAALGRSTGTDPVLWRVLLGVLFCFFGVGALIYLAVWLLVPEEGDQSSPVEALLGRGSSSTSPILVAVLGLVAMGLLVLVIPRPLYLMLLGGTVLLAIVLLNRSRNQPVPPGGPAVADSPPGAAGPAPAAPTAPAAPATGTGPGYSAPSAVPGSGSGDGGEQAEGGTTIPPVPPGPSVADAVPSDAPPTPDPAAAAPPPSPYALSPDPVGVGSSGYRPAFAPRGPFAGPPLPPPPPPPPPPPAPRERSALPSLTFFGMLVALGVLGALDFTGLLDVPVAGYVAAALGVVGAGLVIATWLGRARSLIALGAVLTLALPAVHAADTWDRPEHMWGEFSWTPENTSELADEYSLMFSSGTLDLRQVEFSGRQVDLAVEMSFGDVTVLVPPDVAVDATVDTRFGTATVLGRTLDGVTGQTVHDAGSGDPADGTLRLDLQNTFADTQVNRSSGG